MVLLEFSFFLSKCLFALQFLHCTHSTLTGNISHFYLVFFFFKRLWSYRTYYVLNFSTFWSLATRRKMNDIAIRQYFLPTFSAHP